VLIVGGARIGQLRHRLRHPDAPPAQTAAAPATRHNHRPTNRWQLRTRGFLFALREPSRSCPTHIRWLRSMTTRDDQHKRRRKLRGETGTLNLATARTGF